MRVMDTQAVGLGCLSAEHAIPLKPRGFELYGQGTSAGLAMYGTCRGACSMQMRCEGQYAASHAGCVLVACSTHTSCESSAFNRCL